MQEFKEYVSNLKRKIKANKKDTLFVCIGTNEVIGDCIGPLVGTYLKQKMGNRQVIGDMKNNICSNKDLTNYYSIIKNKFIIAIDSAIVNKELEGNIFVSNTPVIMGLGVNKNKGIIGDISIKASISDLNMEDEKYVYDMSEIIGKGILYWYNEF
jgi:putative sporulation protein YyaC